MGSPRVTGSRGRPRTSGGGAARAPHPVDLKARAHPAPPRRPGLPGREPPPTALIELRADRLPAFANRLRVDHADPHTAEATPEESCPPESHHRMAQGRQIDSVVLAAVLSATPPSTSETPAPA